MNPYNSIRVAHIISFKKYTFAIGLNMFHNSCTRKIPYTPVSSQHTQAQARNQTHKYETFIRLYLTFFSRGSPIRNFYLLTILCRQLCPKPSVSILINLTIGKHSPCTSTQDLFLKNLFVCTTNMADN